MDITVFIPTRGRTNYTPITAEELKKFSDFTPTFVCPTREQSYYARYGNVMPFDGEGIGPARQFILENSPTDCVVMLDDDLYFSKRVDPDNGGKLEKVQGKQLQEMFAYIKLWLDEGFVHGGISARQGNQHIAYPFTDCIRVNNAHFFNRAVVLREGIRFDELPVMEDFFVTLSLLLKGYPNRVLYDYCWSQRASGFKGGCSSYRTPALQAEAAHRLYDLFPDYVKVVEKTSASQSGAMATRTDVNIQWLKAWAAGAQVVTPGVTRPELHLGRH